MSTHVLRVRNVNGALREALGWLKVAGTVEESRNGPVLVAPGPVVTEYARPLERVLFDPTRDANPFFHFFEALWMLGGRNDVAYVEQFNRRMAEFSDDGEALHGAYGFRWREWFAFDQLAVLAQHLREQPATRRAVLTMWSPGGDLVASEGVGGLGMKDLPCNTHCYLDRRGDVLNMSVLCRSNDAVWGAYGANAVHFAFLLEHLAARVGCPAGRLYQYSHNLHLYTERFGEHWRERVQLGTHDSYADGTVAPFPLQGEDTAERWEADLRDFLGYPGQQRTYFFTDFFNDVAQPLLEAHRAYRLGNFQVAHQYVEGCRATDWRLACREWLERREVRP